ncbi:hypothetical protein Tdes44962_MAKER09500 [Teratosphaeria destructans]|uniref:Uncharacterized protein n=1 Tax=Teratosphaeria destructans TaxID=418781 RepID=A0A9W7W2N3_9PEZI|nr:hypothetical protein Tdes44962_MAKER09500 [Teratosphaeria destructans]
MSIKSSCAASSAAWYDEREHPTICMGNIPLPAIILPTIVSLTHILAKVLQKRQHRRALPEDSSDERKDVVDTMSKRQDQPDLVTILLRSVCLIGPFVLCIVLATFLTTCIGWRPVLLYAEARPPTIGEGGVVGMTAFMWIWIGMGIPAWSRRAQNREVGDHRAMLMYEIAFNARVLGWTVTMELCIWMMLRARMLLE